MNNRNRPPVGPQYDPNGTTRPQPTGQPPQPSRPYPPAPRQVPPYPPPSYPPTPRQVPPYPPASNPSAPRPVPPYPPPSYPPAPRQVPPYPPASNPPAPRQAPPPPVTGVYPARPSQYKTFRDQRQKERRRKNLSMGCGLLLGLAILMTVCLGSAAVAAAFVAPVQSNILLLGIDRVPEGTTTGRSDTQVLMRVDSTRPLINTLSVPRDLWVKIPGYGENRINTAHFFAEAAKPGTGPAAAMQTFQEDLGVPVGYYVRVRLEGVPGLIDAMGGVTVKLDSPMGGLEAGTHHLDGTQALAFVRDRKGTDDFFRMAQGEFFIKAAAQQLLNPLTWPRVPLIYAAFWKAVDTNLSIWQLANIGMTVLRVGPANINVHVLPREYTTPSTINGASVLLPKWQMILPLANQLFK